MDHVYPKTRAAAKIWNFYNSENTWNWRPIRDWPVDIVKHLMKHLTLDYEKRFRLFLYLIGNGYNPRDIKQAMKPMLRDRPAEDHIHNLLVDYYRGKLDHYTYWDEHIQKTIALGNIDAEYEAEEQKYPIKRQKIWYGDLGYGGASKTYNGYPYGYEPGPALPVVPQPRVNMTEYSRRVDNLGNMLRQHAANNVVRLPPPRAIPNPIVDEEEIANPFLDADRNSLYRRKRRNSQFG